VSPEDSFSERIEFEIDQINKELRVIENAILLALKDRGLPIPKGEAWHSEVLDAARLNRIISNTLAADLKEFMGFRHFYRHAYGFMLDAELLNPLLEKARAVVNQMSNELGKEG
jgi:hypothetical protein